MTNRELKENLSLEVINESDSSLEITGGYVGDLLSWVMGRAKNGDVWITIMTNLNILAVASLSDVSCVLIAENSEITEEVINTAKEKQINIYRSEKSAFELCGEINKLL